MEEGLLGTLSTQRRGMSMWHHSGLIQTRTGARECLPLPCHQGYLPEGKAQLCSRPATGQHLRGWAVECASVRSLSSCPGRSRCCLQDQRCSEYSRRQVELPGWSGKAQAKAGRPQPPSAEGAHHGQCVWKGHHEALLPRVAPGQLRISPRRNRKSLNSPLP